MEVNKLDSFFESISFKPKSDLSALSIDKVILKKSSETFEVYLKANKPITTEVAFELIECAKKGINGDKKCNITYLYENITNENILATFKFLLNNLINKKPALSGVKD